MENYQNNHSHIDGRQQAEIRVLFKDIEKIEERVSKVEKSVVEKNEDSIKQIYEMEKMFSSLLDSKLLPIFEKFEAQDMRIRAIEDRPKDLALKILLGALSVIGTLLLGVMTMLINGSFK